MRDVETEDDEENFGFSGSGFRVMAGRLDSQAFIFCVSFYKINEHK